MPSSLDAASLSEMAKKGEIKGAIIDGPVAFDLAVSEHARKAKGLAETINGNADIIVVPEIVCGNAISKSLVYMANYRSGGVVLGASCPIILLSRSDSSAEKLNSIILGVCACFTF
jgi:phosphate butyryltransferase